MSLKYWKHGPISASLVLLIFLAGPLAAQTESATPAEPEAPVQISSEAQIDGPPAPDTEAKTETPDAADPDGEDVTDTGTPEPTPVTETDLDARINAHESDLRNFRATGYGWLFDYRNPGNTSL